MQKRLGEMRMCITQVMVSQAITALFWMTLTYVWPFCGYFNAQSDATRSAPTKPRLGMNQPLGVFLYIFIVDISLNLFTRLQIDIIFKID